VRALVRGLYPLSLRNLEEMMAEHGVLADHATVHRWPQKMLPVLAAVFHLRMLPVGASWRVDETYVLLGGQWKYLYRAVDKLGQTVDFLLTAKRGVSAARRFVEQAIDRHDVPEPITIDKNGANTAAVRGSVAYSAMAVELRHSKYLNDVGEQGHRAVKRRTRPMMGFKSFRSATMLIAGIETMQMIRKGQLSCPGGLAFSAAGHFYSLDTTWAAAGSLCHGRSPFMRHIRARRGPVQTGCAARRCQRCRSLTCA
jgi:putative transposase